MFCSSLIAQTGGSGPQISFEFIDQKIQDILFSFSAYARISIIADDTVNGAASFQFIGSDFEQAFDSFLYINRLYVEKRPDLWLVTRIFISADNTGALLVDALDVTPTQLLEKLSQKTGGTILRDILPSAKLSLHFKVPSLSDAVELVMKPFPDYTVDSNDSYIQVKKPSLEQFTPSPMVNLGSIDLNESGGIYDVSIENTRLGDILEKLFLTAKRDYISFIRSDQIIDRIKFSGKSFAETLSMILYQGNGEYSEINNVWYIFPIQQSDILTRLKNDDKAWRRFNIQYSSINDFIPFIQNRFPSIQTIYLSNSSNFYAFVNNQTSLELQEYIKNTDIPNFSKPVRLKYIRTEDLLRSLPPSVKREELVDAGDGNTVFFIGTPERLVLFLEDLPVIDRPQPRIRYDLFIIQIQDTSNLNWAISVDAREMQPGDTTMVTGRLGNIFNLNFDIITVFGYQFAAKINAAIAENQASVFADTTLFGLPGQEIKFQNTSTYRYRDSNIDPETGKPIYSGVTREIVSGLLLNISGWVSGDGMITTTVTASVSKRGADVSSSIGNPPPTSEKVLTTQVRSRSGEIVILSGLKQNDSTIIEERTPLLSRIPLLGWLFRSRDTTKENTQMIIYLVPHVDFSNDEYSIEGLKTASIYNRLVVPYLGKNK
jgi:hypothetical protein